MKGPNVLASGKPSNSGQCFSKVSQRLRRMWKPPPRPLPTCEKNIASVAKTCRSPCQEWWAWHSLTQNGFCYSCRYVAGTKPMPIRLLEHNFAGKLHMELAKDSRNEQKLLSLRMTVPWDQSPDQPPDLAAGADRKQQLVWTTGLVWPRSRFFGARSGHGASGRLWDVKSGSISYSTREVSLLGLYNHNRYIYIYI